MRRKALLAALLSAAAALLFAACGGSSDEPPQVAELDAEPVSTIDDGATSENREAADILLDFTQCIRDEGFNVPDPNFQQSAAETQRAYEERGIDIEDPEFDAAITACEPRLAGILQAFTIDELRAFRDSTVDYSACMRENGIDLPDPDFTQGVTSIFSNELDVTAPGFDEADDACRHVFDDVPDPFAESA
ncbi:MAG: hypothetical protein ACR2OD_04000 [Gaiellaceae bacterium]